MYTDTFDFISTRTSPSPLIEDASQSIRLIPYVPADYNINPSIAQGSTQAKTFSALDLIKADLSKLTSNEPAYKYTTQQEKRYDNPYLQFTPSNILGSDTEDIYGRIQGTPERFLNSFLKTGANFWGTYLSTFLSMGKQIDAWRTGVKFDENGSMESIQSILTALEDKLPNYYTESERNRTDWINALPFSGGAMNFWGDKVIKNIGFSMGALSAGLTADALLTLGTGGLASETAAISAINRIRQASPKLFAMSRNFAKRADQVDNIIDAAKVSNNFSKGLEVSRLSRIPTAARYAATSYFTAQGEAFIEGYHTWLDTRKELLEDAIYRGETDSETLKNAEERAQHAGRWTTALNLPIILFNNAVQFPNLLMGRGVFRKYKNDFIKTLATKDGIQAVSDFSTKKALRKAGYESLKDIVSEGWEEGAQYHIGTSVHDYYSNRLNPNLRNGLAEFILKNVPESLGDDEFWKNVGIGSLTGFLMGTPAQLSTLKARGRTDETVSHLNNVYQRFNSAVKQYALTLDLNNDKYQEHISAHDALYASIHDSLKFGTYDSFMSSLEDLKDLDLDEYNKGFGQDFKTLQERDAFVDGMMQEAVEMKKDIDKVNEFYKNNPYTSDPLTKKIREAFSTKDETRLNNIQENLFNDFKEVVARNESLLRRTNGLILNLKNNLKALGMKDESIEYMKNLTKSPKGLGSYLKYKEAQIKDLEKQVKYYEELSSATTGDIQYDPKVELGKAKKELKKTLDYFLRLSEQFEKLQKNPKDEELQQSILDGFVQEEMLPEHVNRYNEERAKQIQEELERQEQLRKNTEHEIQNPNETAEQIIDANESAEEANVPFDTTVPVVPNIDPLSDFEIGKDVIIDGKTYKVTALGENTAEVKNESGERFRVDKDGKIIPDSPEALLEIQSVPSTGNTLQDKIADIERRRQEELKQVKSLEQTPEQLIRNTKIVEQRLRDAEEIFSFGNTYSDALDNIMLKQKKLNEILRKREKEETKNRDFHQWEKEELEKQPEYQENKRLDKIITLINEVYTEGKSENFNNSTKEAVDYEQNELNNVSSKKYRNTEEIRKINTKYDAELAALEQSAPVEEYLSSKVNLVEPTPQPKLQLGTKEFTKEEIKNYPGTLWTRTPNRLIKDIDVYSIVDNGFIIRRVIPTQDLQGLTVSDVAKSVRTFDKLKGNTTFVQIYFEGEKELITKSSDTLKAEELENQIFNSTLENLIDKKVHFKGIIGTLKKRGNTFEVETNEIIYEIEDGKDKDKASEHFIEPISVNKEVYTPKYKIQILSEDTVVVDGTEYSVVTDNRGNTAGLIPFNRPSQTLKNESLLIAVDIERNKVEYKNIKNIPVENKNNIIQEAKKEFDDLLVLETLYNIDSTTTVTTAIDRLNDNKLLSRTQLSSLNKWLAKKIQKLEQLVVEYPNSLVFQKALDTLLLMRIEVEKQVPTKTYNISDTTETHTVVNNIRYTLILNNIGNVVGLQNQSTVLKSESLLSLVEIERNKFDYKKISKISTVEKDNLLQKERILLEIQSVWEEQMSQNVAESLDLLLSNDIDSISELSLLNTKLWVSETIFQIENLAVKNPNNEYIEQVWFTLNNILETLHSLYTIKYEKQLESPKQERSNSKFVTDVVTKRKTKVSSKGKKPKNSRIKQTDSIYRNTEVSTTFIQDTIEIDYTEQVENLLEDISKNTIKDNVKYYIQAIDYYLETNVSEDLRERLLQKKKEFSIKQQATIAPKTSLKEKFLEDREAEEETSSELSLIIDKGISSKKEEIKKIVEYTSENKTVNTIEENIRSFLGRNTSLQDLFKQQINNQKFKLECI